HETPPQGHSKSFQSGHWENQDRRRFDPAAPAIAMRLTLRLKPYIQPFERTLALAEVKRLTGRLPRPCSLDERNSDYEVEFEHPDVLIRRLAYWEAVTAGRTELTTQVLREATVNVVRNGIDFNTLRSLLPLDSDAIPPNRRCLRYGTHGLHEYR